MCYEFGDYYKNHAHSFTLPDQATIDKLRQKGIPKTWGEAIELRIGKQKADFRNNNPMGSLI